MAAQLPTPMMWLGRLEAMLNDRVGEMCSYNDFYRGDHPLPFVTRSHEKKLVNEFRRMLQESRSNFMRLVVDAVEERMQVDGIRLSAYKSPRADRRSWLIWQANQMDADSNVAMVEALVKGVSYLSVWGDGSDATIAVEDPLQTIVAYRPGSNFREREAALKIWTDEWSGRDMANVYLPEGIYKFEAIGEQEAPRVERVQGPNNTFAGATPAYDYQGQASRKWRELEDEFVKNPLMVVPIVPLRNRGRLLCEGESEISDVLGIQQEINGALFLRQLALYFGAHRQRWATGIKFMVDDTGNEKITIDTAIDTLWANANPDGKFGDFEQTEVTGYNASIEQMVQHIAVTTRTPKHYLLPEGQEPSGDAIKSAEAGLVKKIERKQRMFGEGFEEALRLARMFAGAGSTPPDSEIVWADPQVRSEAEITDAAIKRFAAKLTPWQQTMEDLGYTATQIERMRSQFGDVDPSPAQAAPVDPVPVTDSAA